MRPRLARSLERRIAGVHDSRAPKLCIGWIPMAETGSWLRVVFPKVWFDAQTAGAERSWILNNIACLSRRGNSDSNDADTCMLRFVARHE
jgi:hypothetical protein